MDPRLTLSIIAAVAENGVIGYQGGMPWQLRSDLRRFAKLTKGHTVIVGRKTHESIVARLGHPLRDRNIIVVTHQPRYKAEGPNCEVLDSWGMALEAASFLSGEAFVIGGEQLYRLI